MMVVVSNKYCIVFKPDLISGLMAGYSILFWDLDGTIINPREGIISSVVYALQKLGIREKDEEFLSQFIGPPLQESFETLAGLDPVDAMKAVELYRENFSGNGAMFRDSLYDGILQLLRELKSKGAVQLMVTSKPTVFADQIAVHHGIHDCFLKIIGSSLDGTRTSKTDLLKEAMDYFQDGRRGEMAVIGDRKYEINAARAAGIKSIAVSYGYGSMQEILEAGPSHVAGSVPDLAMLLLP